MVMHDDFTGPIAKYVATGNIHAAGYLKMTCKNFLFNPVALAMHMNEHSRLTKISSTNENGTKINIKFIVPAPYVPPFMLSEFNITPFEVKNKVYTPSRKTLVEKDKMTDRKAKKNFQLHMPPTRPSGFRTAKGPTWRNLVIPRDPVMMEIA